MEAAVRWSPLSNHGYQRFLLADVTGNSLTLFRADSLTAHNLHYTPIAQRTNLQNFTAFDWSRTDPSLVALAFSTGEASVVSIDPEHAQDDALHNFTIKTQRKCNTITFSPNNLLAIGLDRVRHDHCLTVYDLNAKEPHTKLCVSEAVTSVKFFPTHPLELLAAVSRQTIRLYDLREASSSTAGIGHYGSTKLVNNIAIDPLDENYFASGGSTGDPTVTIWDKRWMSRSGGTPNPDGAVNSTVLELRPAVDNSQTTSVWSIRYSGRKRGRLCLLSSTGEVKLYDTAQHHVQSKSRTPPANIHGDIPWSSPHYVARTHNLQWPNHHTQQQQHHQRDVSKVIAFDWVSSGEPDGQPIIALRPDRTVHLMHAPHPAHINMTARDDLALCLHQVQIYEPSAKQSRVADELKALHEAKKPALDPSALGRLPDQSDPLDQQSLRALNRATTTAAARTEKWLDTEILKIPEIVRQADFAHCLTLLTAQKRRCQEGYLFDCHHNAKLVADDPTLVKLWLTIARLDDLAADGGMVSESLDLSFLGVHAVWAGQLGSGPNRVVSSRSLVPATFEDAVNGVLETHGLLAFEGPETEKPDQRQLCLAICGSAFSFNEAKERCDELREQQQYYRAVAVAMFQGYKGLALEILRDLIRGKALQNIGLGALLASDRLNKEQREICAWMEEDATDPYLQAVLTFLGSGSWLNVVNKLNLDLDLSDRLIIAFKHLEDKEITTFIQRSTDAYIQSGDVEGILLTGLATESMDLFQSFIRRTNDLQTAVLATAFTNPLYVDDVRWEMWKETYFMQMQSWRAFIERTKFSMLHTRRFCVTHSGRKIAKPPPRQLTLRCAHCQGSLASNIDGVAAGMNGAKNGIPGTIGTPTTVAPPAATDASRTRITGLAVAAGTICPRCGRHLPRCALCMQWLGTPEPTRAKEIINDLMPGISNIAMSNNNNSNSTITGGGGGGGSGTTAKETTDPLSNFVTFCASCTHGFHAHHARVWFSRHAMCPVPDCRCLCGLRR